MARPAKWKPGQLEAALLAYASGDTSVRDVKRDYGIPPTTLLRYCHDRGIPVRASGMKGVTGDKHPTWVGGFRIDDDGYVRTYAPDHPWPRKTPYVFEHVRVVELQLGRKLTSSETVHHIDGDKQNNSLENLEVLNRGDHSRLHRERDAHNRKRNRLGQFA